MRRIAIVLAVLLGVTFGPAPGMGTLDSRMQQTTFRGASIPEKKTSPSPKTQTADETRLLIATRQVKGPFFSRSVVLLMEHKPSGSLGLILNLPTPTLLTDVFPEISQLAERRDRVHLGGPVHPKLMTFLIRSDQTPPDSTLLLEDVYATASADALLQTIEKNTPTSRFHAYVGYSGWAPGQLDTEIARGDWYLVPADAGTIFDSAPNDLWKRLVAEHEGIQVRNPYPKHEIDPTG